MGTMRALMIASALLLTACGADAIGSETDNAAPETAVQASTVPSEVPASNVESSPTNVELSGGLAFAPADEPERVTTTTTVDAPNDTTTTIAAVAPTTTSTEAPAESTPSTTTAPTAGPVTTTTTAPLPTTTTVAPTTTTTSTTTTTIVEPHATVDFLETTFGAWNVSAELEQAVLNEFNAAEFVWTGETIVISLRGTPKVTDTGSTAVFSAWTDAEDGAVLAEFSEKRQLDYLLNGEPIDALVGFACNELGECPPNTTSDDFQFTEVHTIELINISQLDGKCSLDTPTPLPQFIDCPRR